MNMTEWIYTQLHTVEAVHTVTHTCKFNRRAKEAKSRWKQAAAAGEQGSWMNEWT